MTTTQSHVDRTWLIGISVAVPEPHGGFLQRARVAFGDPAGWAIPTHITLLPPTAVTAPTLDAVQEHLESLTASLASFVVELSGTGTFLPVSPVAFVGMTTGVTACTELADQVLAGPLYRPRGFPYHPHVTIAHHLAEPELDLAQHALVDYEARFEVESFDLYQQIAGTWRPIRRYLLGGTQ